MALVGGLCFCNACGNLLERAPASRREISCDVCATTNQNIWPSTTVETSRPRSLPSRLRTILRDTIQDVAEEDLKDGQQIQQTCEKCSSPEMYFTVVQLRSADEGTTVFYVCRRCGHRYKEDN